MALIGLTESDLQDQIHTLYENDSSTPASTDADYTIRRNLINTAINRWENDMGYLWNELWTNTTLYSTGAVLTITSGTATYATPDNFRFPGGYVRIYNGTDLVKKLRVVKPEEAQKFSATTDYAYFRGDPGNGYTLVLNPAPGTDLNGYTITYDFYKRATAMSDTTDTPEMSDPYYIVWSVVAELNKADNNIALYESALNEAETRLKQMEVLNTMQPHYQDYGLDDNQVINSNAGFGV